MKVLVDGQLIEYKDEGKGKTILLLHGWASSLQAFDGLAAALAARFRVVRLDFPGFGGSPRPESDWQVGDYANLTAAFLKKLRLKPYALIGHSFGGRVIIKGFATGTLTADKVVLLGAAGPKPPRSLKKLAFKAAAKSGKAITALPGLKGLQPALRKKLYGAAGATDYLHAGEMRRIFLNTINEDLLPAAASIDRPVLMIWGENDHEVPVKAALQLRERIPAAELVVVPDAGHFVHTDDEPAVLAELEKFL